MTPCESVGKAQQGDSQLKYISIPSPLVSPLPFPYELDPLGSHRIVSNA
jgi:hypothetical protein